MAKRTVSGLFLGSALAAIAGSILATGAVWLAYANNAFVVSGWNVTGIQSTPIAWTLVGLAVVGLLVTMGGVIGVAASWVGALLNTVRLEDKTWFVLVLVLGLFSFGVLALVAYVIAGPDGSGTPASGPYLRHE